MSEEIEPALTPEEWASLMDGTYIEGKLDPSERDYSEHAVAAWALHGQPFGFTWAMADALEQAVYNDADPGDHSRIARDAIACIAALLPPREP